jgi:hypothetical protein
MSKQEKIIPQEWADTVFSNVLTTYAEDWHYISNKYYDVLLPYFQWFRFCSPKSVHAVLLDQKPPTKRPSSLSPSPSFSSRSNTSLFHPKQTTKKTSERNNFDTEHIPLVQQICDANTLNDRGIITEKWYDYDTNISESSLTSSTSHHLHKWRKNTIENYMFVDQVSYSQLFLPSSSSSSSPSTASIYPPFRYVSFMIEEDDNKDNNAKSMKKANMKNACRRRKYLNEYCDYKLYREKNKMELLQRWGFVHGIIAWNISSPLLPFSAFSKGRFWDDEEDYNGDQESLDILWKAFTDSLMTYHFDLLPSSLSSPSSSSSSSSSTTSPHPILWMVWNKKHTARDGNVVWEDTGTTGYSRESDMNYRVYLELQKRRPPHDIILQFFNPLKTEQPSQNALHVLNTYLQCFGMPAVSFLPLTHVSLSSDKDKPDTPPPTKKRKKNSS